MKLTNFVYRLSGELESAGRFRASTSRRSTLNSVLSFCRSAVPSLKQVYTVDFLHRYEEYLISRGCVRNTTSYYMSVLRSIYNVAVEAGELSYNPGLFSGVFTGSDPTVKRAVSSDVISAIHYADLSGASHLEFCRDLFMLSFHLQGMSFVDMAYLLKSDVRGDYIFYRRHKTSGVVCVSILPPAKQIIDKYISATTGSPYVLPIVTQPGATGRLQYQTALHRQNRQLKLLASYLNITDNLTSYVARHSWATLAYHNGAEVSMVSQAMGHHTEEVTRIYLSSFDQSQLTRVNLIVLNAILRPEKEEKGMDSKPDNGNYLNLPNDNPLIMRQHAREKRKKKKKGKIKAVSLHDKTKKCPSL